MSSKPSPVLPLVLAALTAVGVAYGITELGKSAKVAAVKAPATAPVRPIWSATASGRVEPKSGEIKLAALASGRIDEVLVKANDKVKAGDLLIRLDETEAMARILGADAEAGVRKRERDTEKNVPKLAEDRRTAEDKLNNTERAIALARQSLDKLLIARSVSDIAVTDEQLGAARQEVEVATSRLNNAREEHRQTQLASGAPLPTRLEAGLTAARAELSSAEAAWERTRIRASIDATVIEVFARVGETAAAASGQPLLVIGDLSNLRVRAEVEERDVSKVAVGQIVVLKTDAYVDKEFTGRVARIAQALRPPKLAQRGPRRPNDIDSLEVMIDVDAGSDLLPGMRVDVFFKADADDAGAAQSSKAGSGDKAPDGKAAAMDVKGKAAEKPASVVKAAAPAATSNPQVLPPLPASKPAGNPPRSN